MESNVNSFADHVAKLTESCKEIMQYTDAMNKTLSGETPSSPAGTDIVLPSYTNIVERVERAENTISKFTQGKGVVETDDGTYRKVKVATISRPPAQVQNVGSVDTFGADSNWFFESLQYPKCVVRVELKGKIDDDSDRVYVNRIILDANDTAKNGQVSMLDFYNDAIKDKNISYVDLITLLTENNAEFREDREEVALPLRYEKFYGKFAVISTSLVKDSDGVSRQWYTLDTTDYYLMNEDGIAINNSYSLKTGDFLRYGNSLFEISDINRDTNSVKLKYSIGYENIAVGETIELYNDPFSEKKINVGIGIDEINIIYVKAVNENYNLISVEWSDPISFYTNELSFEDDINTTFQDYYTNNVSDFGKSWIAQAKDGQIGAYNGKKPYAPVLNADDMRVVAINTQLENTIDSEEYNKLTTEIASTKSRISALRESISTNKDLLVQTSNNTERKGITLKIDSDTNALTSATAQFNSLVEELNTLLNSTDTIAYTPKYRVRGFFSIPESRYTNEDARTGEQAIIGFETKYRYLHTDETGIKLDTYEYTNKDNTIQSGVFSDWNLVSSNILNKVYDDAEGRYVWMANDTNDGSQVNINQIDIPIRNGEKVEIMVRSISEAGYPYNPLRSEWSNSIIIEFPENLVSAQTSMSVMESAKNDLVSIMLQQTMTAAGVYSHINDSNSTYKHACSGISYLYKTGTNSYEEHDLQNTIDTIITDTSKVKNDTSTLITALATINTMQNTISSLNETIRNLTNKINTMQATINEQNDTNRAFNLAYKNLSDRVDRMDSSFVETFQSDTNH